MKAELKKNSLNQVIKGTNIFEEGDAVTEIGLVIKGRVRVFTGGVNMVLGSGNFLGICDLSGGTHNVTYTAEINSAVYTFSVSSLNSALSSLMKVNKDYAPLMVSTLSKHIRELSKIFDELENMANSLQQFIEDTYRAYQSIGRTTGVKANTIRSIEEPDTWDKRDSVNLGKVAYYRACAELPADVQKAYFGANQVITLYHITEQIALINDLLAHCKADAEYLQKLADPLVKNERSLYMSVLQQANVLQKMGENTSEVMSLFDDIIDRINTLDNLLHDRAGIDLEIDHEFMEQAYFELLNSVSGEAGGAASALDGLVLDENAHANPEELYGALDQILDYAELEPDAEESFRKYMDAFMAMPDKFSTEDDARTIRRGIIKIYYGMYKKVFLKDYKSNEETPLAIDLFLRYGFLSEKLVSDNVLEELLMLDPCETGNGDCAVYDMKEWLTLILQGKKEPSKSEFDLDYDENLRDMRKTGQITAEQQQKMSGDLYAKMDYELQNMFRTNHRLMFSQVSAFVPFLFQESCTTSISKSYLSKAKINAAVQRILQIDYSVFYRESLYAKEGSSFAKEYIQQEVFPDIVVFPCYGNKGVMWQELSGRRRTSKGRFLLPIFMEGELYNEMIKLFGRFRWELCRTVQGSSWNNIQIKSLTSEYSDFVQFYRKNRELSEDKKEKLKLQIQKCRNNTREVFVLDYDNWIRHEAQGGLTLSKPVREIMATYCPFVRELREKVGEQPMFRDAMARFQRERGKKTKEYDLKFKVWTKDEVEVPEEVLFTKRFYTEL
ncbi:MAG: hypothetical protein LUH14_12490 [Clostridiaceae bacterium]|nr:hypothetical protein [Clostridiaceae bacterium]